MASAARTRLPPSFNRLAWSNLAAQSAEQIAVAAAPIVTVVALGGGAGETGLIETAQTLPFLLFALPAGMLADRMSRRSVMAYAEALRVISLIAILALAELGLLTWPLLALLGLIGACGTVAYSVAAPSLSAGVGAFSGACQRELANRTRPNTCLRCRTGLGGVRSSDGPVQHPRSVLQLRCLPVQWFWLAGLNEPPRPPLPPPSSPRGHSARGPGFVFRHPLLRPVFVTQFLFNTAFFVLLAVFVPYAIRSLGLSASARGRLPLGTFGIGMVVGALVAGRMIRSLPFGIVVAIGPIAGLAAALVMVLTISIPSALLAGLSFFLLGSRSYRLGHRYYDAAPNGHATGFAWPRIGDQHHGVRSSADRRWNWRVHRGVVRDGSLPGRGRHRISRAGRRDPDLTGRPSCAPA